MPNPGSVSVSLRKFLTLSACPEGWEVYDLYLIRDGEVAFYAGQSGCAFQRVWEHIQGGVHGHSIPGRFLLANWPKSGSFTVELFSSRAARFGGGGLDAAERALIEEWRPCFNVTLNRQPLPLPAGYRPANAPLKYLRSYRRMLREAAYAVKQEAARESAAWENAGQAAARDNAPGENPGQTWAPEDSAGENTGQGAARDPGWDRE